MFSSVQSLSCVLAFVTPWTAAHQASLSITNSRSLLKLMSIESVMSSNHLILNNADCLQLGVILVLLRVYNHSLRDRLTMPVREAVKLLHVAILLRDRYLIIYSWPFTSLLSVLDAREGFPTP